MTDGTLVFYWGRGVAKLATRISTTEVLEPVTIE
jgi:hypothetical protein